MPGLALPGGRRRDRNPALIAVIGDSRKAANHANATRRAGGGPEAWACALSHQSYRLILNRGQSGKRTDEYLSEPSIADIIASPAGIVTMLGALNDIGQDYPTQTTSGATAAANVMAAARRFLSAGLRVVIEADPGQNGMAAVRVLQINVYNAIMREFCERTPGTLWHDARPILVDPAGATSTVLMRSGMTYDGTHTSQRGGYHWGKSLKALFDTLAPARPLVMPAPGEVPANGRFQLLANPIFAAGSGGTSTTGVTGAIPAGCRANKSGTGTTGAMTTAVQNAVMNVAFGAQGDNVRLTSDVALSDWNPGEWVQVAARLAVANPSGLAGIELLLQANGDGATTNVSDLAPNPAWTGPDESFEATLLSDPFRVPAYAAKGYLATNIMVHAFSAGSPFTVAIRYMGTFRRLADYANAA